MRELRLQVGPRALVVDLGGERDVLSSAAVGGGLVRARSIVNLRVPKNDPCRDPAAMVRDFAQEASVPGPWVGLLTAADPACARVEERSDGDLSVLVAATVGLGNPFAAGEEGAVPALAADRTPPPGTINLVAVIDGAPVAAALVNAVITLTEVKTAVLGRVGVRTPGGKLATGTSSDAVAVASLGEGAPVHYGGPASELGALLAHAARRALDAAVADALAGDGC